MKFYTARQAIHDAYAIHMRSKGFEVNLTAAVSELDVLKELSAMRRKLDKWQNDEQLTPAQKRQKAELLTKIDQYAPVAFAHGDRSSKVDADRLIWDSKDAAKVISVVEGLPVHLKAWCYWCYSPLGDTNQSWLKLVDLQNTVKRYQSEADELSNMAAGLPDRIAKCKTDERRAELEAIDTDELNCRAMKLEAEASRFERSLRQPNHCAPFWNWLDERIVEQAPAKIRKKTLLHVRDVCRASVYNYRHQVVTGIQKPLMSRKVVCEKFDVPSSNFEGSYRPWVSWASVMCDELDKTALPQIARKMR
ncbi:hypothetical protein [uncultured Endozoicomonas sp.]|uniref:hypothetical protein n=1 Tax=uncultured Endozoicomonas sp. TaxID=432652 RepID=UPI002631CDD5|nr:hypothetical protein [uncultured Endozoicomonas sp.]